VTPTPEVRKIAGYHDDRFTEIDAGSVRFD
jgi:hypothetical protein